jgi:formate dehydrogenase subunit delta
MNIHHLVKMANQIGQFFQSEPDQNQAINDITVHLKRNWDPRMRKQILSHVKDGGEGLLPIVLKAIQDNQQLLA